MMVATDQRTTRQLLLGMGDPLPLVQGLTSPSSAAASLPDLLGTLYVRAGGAAEPEPFEMTPPMLAGWDGIRSGQKWDNSSSRLVA